MKTILMLALLSPSLAHAAECLDELNGLTKKTCIVLPYNLSLGKSLDEALQRNQSVAQHACGSKMAQIQKGIEITVIDDPGKWSLQVAEKFRCEPW
ncbi:MAG: hypothetical protein ACXWQO_05275 [Bdellovibrionota bacterium]